MTSGANSIGFYVSGGLILLVGALKLPALMRRRSDTLLRAACLLLFSAGLLMLLAAPQSIVTLNRLTGIPNIAALLVYAVTMAFSGSSLMLIVNWRSVSAGQTRVITRLCATVYSLVIVVLVVLFWAGDTPVEQVTLFDAYYATTPFIREMIVLYLAAQAVAMTAAGFLCWRWSGQVRGSLRAGLYILAPAYLLIVVYDVMRLIAVSARWLGRDLDRLIEISPQFAAPACLLGATGFAVPLAGPRIAETARAIGDLRRLAPLWRQLQDVPTPGAVRATLPWWRTDPAVLLTGRKTALYDALLALAPHADPAVREAAHRSALRRGEDEGRASATADAAMILVARERQRTSSGRLPADVPPASWRSQDLPAISQALASPVVEEAVRTSRPSQKAAHHE
ncbi:MAB_1171c family putative transporter [Streptomyces sp. NPDC049915]|uniref:MAB_1171c family putative transporter n=1 Tax=Streptomyces sp. NPDC049915 TaxID=3155510 RepID=UPI00344A86F2